MSHDVATNGPQPDDADRGLPRLAELANEAHENFRTSMRRAVAHALEAGQALLEAKDLCPDKGWAKWLAANFRPSASTARGYMRLATYWPQVGEDRQRVGGLSYNGVMGLIKGLACADGRANPARRKLAAPAAPADGANARADGAGANHGGPSLPPELAAFRQFGRLLHQALVELRRMIEANRPATPYARHLLQPLERILDGLPGYKWPWDDLTPRR